MPSELVTFLVAGTKHLTETFKRRFTLADCFQGTQSIFNRKENLHISVHLDKTMCQTPVNVQTGNFACNRNQEQAQVSKVPLLPLTYFCQSDPTV